MQFVWQRGIGYVPLSLELQYNYIPVSGVIPTVEVYRYSDNYYLDWTTMTFKPQAAAGNRYGTMSEVPSDRGMYLRSFNPALAGDDGGTLYYVRYRAVIPSGFRPSVSKDINVQDSEWHYFINVTGSGSGGSSLAMEASFIKDETGC